MTGSGFKVSMTVDQAKMVNPLADTSVNAVVPWDRVQASWDGNYHICIYPRDRGAPRGGVICFWAPSTS
jgi:hypothetical protein